MSGSPVSWTCEKCRENIEGDLEVCWKCGTSHDGVEDPHFRPDTKPEAVIAGGVGQTLARPVGRVVFQIFYAGALTSWEALFEEAAAFASQLPPDRLISISHSADSSRGLVSVWYREEGDEQAVESIDEANSPMEGT